MGVEVKSRPIGDGEAVEVDLCINVQAKRGDSADVQRQPRLLGHVPIRECAPG
jgi:hypothetical protein